MTILVSKQRILCKEKTLCKEKDAKKAKKNIHWNSTFLGHFVLKITIFCTFSSWPLLFSNNSINKTSVTEKPFSKYHNFPGICVTNLIHYCKIEIKIQRIQIFLRFFATNEKCKNFTHIICTKKLDYPWKMSIHCPVPKYETLLIRSTTMTWG